METHVLANKGLNALRISSPAIRPCEELPALSLVELEISKSDLICFLIIFE